MQTYNPNNILSTGNILLVPQQVNIDGVLAQIDDIRGLQIHQDKVRSEGNDHALIKEHNTLPSIPHQSAYLNLLA